MMAESFFSILQLAIGTKSVDEICLDENSLSDAFACAKKHSLVGVFYSALLKLRESGYNVDYILFLRSYGLTEKLKQKNLELDEDCTTITAKFSEAGFDSCILKGQGLALLYPDCLVRNSGDVDIWVMPKESCLPLEQRREIIYNYCSKLVGKSYAVYHHMDLPVMRNSIEVHFTPSWMFSPFSNKKLQRFFDEQWKGRRLTQKGFYVPSVEFNLVYVLVHIYRHLFDEGIGLRQCLDYYWTLQTSLVSEASIPVDDCKVRTMAVLRDLGMARFTAAMMYVLQTAFAMEPRYMLCEPDEKVGKVVLTEILTGGNFGQYDHRYAKKDNDAQRANGFKNLWIQIQRNVKYLRFFPSEVLWNVPFRIWHYCWRKKKGWR